MTLGQNTSFVITEFIEPKARSALETSDAIATLIRVVIFSIPANIDVVMLVKSTFTGISYTGIN